MTVLVCDTSVLIDLKRGALLEISFRLQFEFAVPDLLYERELKTYGGGELLKLGLRIEELDGAGVSRALAYRVQRPALSVPDSFALALAHTHSWTLLTGDGGLRELANAEHGDCHGALWGLDQRNDAGVVTAQALHDGLTASSEFPRRRLPKPEIHQRLTLYAALLSGRGSQAQDL